MPRELEAFHMVQMFGHSAVYGQRRLGIGEMRRANLAQRIQTAFNARDAYRDKDGAKSWAEWAGKHPDEAELLANAAREAHG